MTAYQAPGVYREQVLQTLPPSVPSGVPAFVGLIGEGAGETTSFDSPRPFTRWSQFEQDRGYGALEGNGFLASAVRGFFENGGRLCYVHVARYAWQGDQPAALARGLQALETLREADLVCAPDILWAPEGGTLSDDAALRMQIELLNHCQTQGDRFALLDALPGQVGAAWQDARSRVIEQRRQLFGANGALYFPWIRVRGSLGAGERLIPPCGHVAGVIARTDERRGVHKAPANELLEGVLGLERALDDAQQGELNPIGVNCLRVFPGRGIRVWGARTLSGEPAWLYVNVRRIFITAGRWIERNMADRVFEPNDARLWAHITRDLNAYFADLFRKGALKGNSPDEAFYVKCNEETNPPEARDRGEVVAEIGLAPAQPYEFIVVRIVQRVGGVSIEGPARPA